MAITRLGRTSQIQGPGNGMKTLDLNADGLDDVVAHNIGEIQCPTAGKFWPSVGATGVPLIMFGFTQGTQTLSPVLVDLNGNGKLDVVALEVTTSTASLWI